MGVPAHTNAFGLSIINTSVPYEQETIRNRDGRVTKSTGASSHMVNWHNRGPKTSNPLQANGERSNSGYGRTIARGRLLPGSITLVGSSSTTTRSGYPLDTATVRNSLQDWPIDLGYQCLSSQEEQAAITKALVKLQEQKANSSVFLAESVKSANMIADRAGWLWSNLLAIKRGDYRQLAREFKSSRIGTIPNGYLEWKYGWRPLCSELYNMVREFGERDPQGFIISTGASETNTYAGSPADNSNWTDRQQSATVKGRCRIRARITNDTMRSASQWGLINPLLVGWEVIPFSFVVDWGMPIGNLLTGLSAGAGLEFVSGSSSTTMDAFCEGRRKTTWTGLANGVRYDIKSNSRKALGDIPMPRLYAQNPFRTSNVLSALSLLSQLTFSGSRRIPRHVLKF